MACLNFVVYLINLWISCALLEVSVRVILLLDPLKATCGLTRLESRGQAFA